MVTYMTRIEGISFDRVRGYEGMKVPKRDDFDRVKRLLARAKGEIRYKSGCKVD